MPITLQILRQAVANDDPTTFWVSLNILATAQAELVGHQPTDQLPGQVSDTVSAQDLARLNVITNLVAQGYVTKTALAAILAKVNTTAAAFLYASRYLINNSFDSTSQTATLSLFNLALNQPNFMNLVLDWVSQLAKAQPDSPAGHFIYSYVASICCQLVLRDSPDIRAAHDDHYNTQGTNLACVQDQIEAILTGQISPPYVVKAALSRDFSYHLAYLQHLAVAVGNTAYLRSVATTNLLDCNTWTFLISSGAVGIDLDSGIMASINSAAMFQAVFNHQFPAEQVPAVERALTTWLQTTPAHSIGGLQLELASLWPFSQPFRKTVIYLVRCGLAELVGTCPSSTSQVKELIKLLASCTNNDLAMEPSIALSAKQGYKISPRFIVGYNSNTGQVDIATNLASQNYFTALKLLPPSQRLTWTQEFFEALWDSCHVIRESDGTIKSQQDCREDFLNRLIRASNGHLGTISWNHNQLVVMQKLLAAADCSGQVETAVFWPVLQSSRWSDPVALAHLYHLSPKQYFVPYAIETNKQLPPAIFAETLMAYRDKITAVNWRDLKIIGQLADDRDIPRYGAVVETLTNLPNRDLVDFANYLVPELSGYYQV